MEPASALTKLDKITEKQEKDTVVSLEHVCAHSVCNDVWWRPYPTNLHHHSSPGSEPK